MVYQPAIEPGRLVRAWRPDPGRPLWLVIPRLGYLSEHGRPALPPAQAPPAKTEIDVRRNQIGARGKYVKERFFQPQRTVRPALTFPRARRPDDGGSRI